MPNPLIDIYDGNSKQMIPDLDMQASTRDKREREGKKAKQRYCWIHLIFDLHDVAPTYYLHIPIYLTSSKHNPYLSYLSTIN